MPRAYFSKRVTSTEKKQKQAATVLPVGEKETSRTSGRDAQMLEVNESEPLLSSSKNGAVPAGANSAEGGTYGGELADR